MAYSIDTHQKVQHLMQGKVFTKEQAERIVDAISEADEQVVTKTDLENTELRLTTKMYTGFITTAGLIIAAIKYL